MPKGLPAWSAMRLGNWINPVTTLKIVGKLPCPLTTRRSCSLVDSATAPNLRVIPEVNQWRGLTLRRLRSQRFLSRIAALRVSGFGVSLHWRVTSLLGGSLCKASCLVLSSDGATSVT